MYISTREMVISIICNACGVIGLILWAIEAHKSNASQRIQSVKSVDHKDEPQTAKVIGCSKCSVRFWCTDRDMPHAVHCNNYGKSKDEQTAKE